MTLILYDSYQNDSATLLAPVVQWMFNGCSGIMFYERAKICFNVKCYGRSAIKHRKPSFDCYVLKHNI